MFRLDETRLFEILDGPLPWPFGHICSGSNFFDTFGCFFVIMFVDVSKPIPIPRDPRSLKSAKIKLRPFSAALGSPWPPKCVPRMSKWCSEESKISLKWCSRTGVRVGLIAANGYQCLYITARPCVKTIRHLSVELCLELCCNPSLLSVSPIPPTCPVWKQNSLSAQSFVRKILDGPCDSFLDKYSSKIHRWPCKTLVARSNAPENQPAASRKYDLLVYVYL